VSPAFQVISKIFNQRDDEKELKSNITSKSMMTSVPVLSASLSL
jgi:hypothetical protein